MTMSGKGGLKVDNAEGYQLMDRSCRAGHGGACFLQAKILGAQEGSLGPGVPHDAQKAMKLYENNCIELGDSVSCFELATILLRGTRVDSRAKDVTPQQARGLETAQSPNQSSSTSVSTVPRDAKRAEELLLRACDTGAHVTSCHNLAVMYHQGDEGIPADKEKADKYAKKTESMMSQFGGF
eukprot:CAMPEP_0172470778 /NCGR_PEP_ID=MMETSP1065-20121228/67258_1 /TAXON_ID=265537 /ORGANISM="Amphiprora paludosa, Strain CCMP125" /LENGTH=181 /DNA_ID=CAMNT_0013228821 /DNA_START=150 /DNA_END=695 /DNA_ORIENTATION=+